MNWLLISQSIQDEKIKGVENLLFTKNETEPYEIFLSEPMDSEELYDCMKHTMQATHCVILDCDTLAEHQDFIFLLGLLVGKRVRTFVHGDMSRLEHFSALDFDGQGLFKCFATIEELVGHLECEYPAFERQDYEHNSLIQLFTLGIPFTADSFAYYLEKDKEEIYKLFVHAGMTVNTKTSEGVPMLSVAARNDHPDQIEWLLSLGADINAISGDRGYSAVMDAVWRKNFQITEYLIKRGADLGIVSTDGQPILVLAVGNGNEKIVRLLLENGADPDIKDSMGMSARQYANLFKKPGLVELMDQFPQKN